MRPMLRTATYTVTLVTLAVLVTTSYPDVSRRLFRVPHLRPQGAASAPVQPAWLPPIAGSGAPAAFFPPKVEPRAAPHMTATLERGEKAAPKITAACEHTGVTLTR